jgi:pyruvate-ferredoxin/flavodoxin oxidoreductase
MASSVSAERRIVTLDGNEAAASVAYRASEVIAIYPITPSSTMGELADEWAAAGVPNAWSTIPHIAQMQSEAGVAGAIHGALQAGALATTFTASQGLLLMIPDMYKIAGELTSFAMHVSARTLATHALSIFGDHGDVMSCRQTGFALLASGSVQEAHDMAMIAHAATLKSRVPFLHFFDGFRTSHEINKIEMLSDADVRSMLDDELIAAHRGRALNPDRPVLRGTAQNPDVFFQAREACNGYYDACAQHVLATMDDFARLTGRRYHLFDYIGHPQAERVIIIMGSGAEVAHETIDWMLARGERVGVLKVRLYRPFDAAAVVSCLPRSVRSIAVMDRTKEPGSTGDPLYLDVVAALRQTRGTSGINDAVRVISGRYGLSSKDFTPAQVKAVFDELAGGEAARPFFTVGINDDVTHLSLPVDESFDIEPADVTRALFFGLGADGTVGANKNTIKIIGEETESQAQGYFVYDSKKSGTMTVSHLRFSPRPIRSSYLVRQAGFVACHNFVFLSKVDMLRYAAAGATFLLNAPYGPEQVWDHLPAEVQKQIIDKRLRFWVIDADRTAADLGLPGRINTIMQTCFFAISNMLPREEAITQIKKALTKTYARKGEDVVRKNIEMVDKTVACLFEVKVPASVTGKRRPLVVSAEAPEFVQRVSAEMIAGRGDDLPVSAFAPDGTWPMATTQWEKRNIASEIPVWEPGICIQCNKCAMACPHAAIRPKIYSDGDSVAPHGFKAVPYKAQDFKGFLYTLQVAPEDCTGCNVCVAVCPAKDKTNPSRKAINMAAQEPLREQEVANYKHFLAIPEVDRTKIRLDVKGSQFLQPLFEYSGACSGCGETPYIKLLTQLFGDRAMIANATGCTSIYGGNLPTTPYCTTNEGRGPAWSNSLFEDNAEFGYGMRLAVDKHTEQAQELLKRLNSQLGDNTVRPLLETDQSSEAGIALQRLNVAALRASLRQIDSPEARRLAILSDYLVRKSIWIVGGDGWAYDIGYGGLDHVLAQNRNVNILVLDTEVYSNTGGQQSKATPMGATAKFASAGKSTFKKDLGMMAMCYGTAYVASVAFGAKDTQTVKAMLDAESYDGPSLIIAYSHCIAHGYDLAHGPDQQKLAVDSGYWLLYRFDPRLSEAGQNPLQLDSSKPKLPLEKYLRNEIRFRTVERQNPERYRQLTATAQQRITGRFVQYEQLARPWQTDGGNGHAGNGDTPAAQRPQAVPADKA